MQVTACTPQDKTKGNDKQIKGKHKEKVEMIVVFSQSGDKICHQQGGTHTHIAPAWGVFNVVFGATLRLDVAQVNLLFLYFYLKQREVIILYTH